MAEKTLPINAHISESSLLQPSIQLWKHYLTDQGRSVYTIKAFVADLNLLSSYLPPDKQVGSITTKDLESFLNWLEKERNISCSPKSLARRITSLKSFFRWLSQYGAISVDPAEKIVQVAVISPLPVVLTSAEIKQLTDYANDLRFGQTPDARPYTLLSLVLETAIKKGECLALTKNHLELDDSDGAFIFVRYTNPRYRYKERKISVSEIWVEACREYLEQYQPEDQVFPWSPRRLEYILEFLGQAVGLSKHVSFDMCRWSCALQDLINGIDPDKIRQKLGISKIQWREIFLKLRRLAKEQGFDFVPEDIEANN